jgi:hypothetical protein
MICPEQIMVDGGGAYRVTPGFFSILIKKTLALVM